MRTLLVLGLVSSLGGLCACPNHESDDDDTSFNCQAVADDDEFVVGLTKTGDGNKLEFKLLSSDPAPPSRGDNTWVLLVSTLAAPAAPVTGAVMTVTPFMPAHEHGSGKTVTITPLSEPGQYKLDPVNLWMPGVWETTIDVSGPNGDKVVFRFCLPS